ncbi:MAG: T9SS type A sorting domain-containing protein [Crocinitomicaceae bacterium]|nr:T9SS type A sorting domain-containing protein [Crocinitomicaceae bacterium]
MGWIRISKFYFSLICLFLHAFILKHHGFAQIPTRGWRMHISPFDGVGVAQRGDVVYAALKNGLLSYNTKTNEKTLRTATDFLSDVTISALALEPKHKVVFIGYDNGNLDLLIGSRVFNIPAIVQASSISGLRRINKMLPNDGDMYLATAFGIVVINTKRREVRDTYRPTAGVSAIVDIAFSQDSIFALTRNGLFRGALSNNFLADPAQWQNTNYLSNHSATGEYNSIVFFNDKLFVGYNDEIYSSDTIYVIENGQRSVWKSDIEIKNIEISGQDLLVLIDGATLVYDDQLAEKMNIFQYLHGSFPGPKAALFHEGYYYIADERSGLVKAANAFNTNRISFEGPQFASSFRLDWNAGKLAVAGGALNGNNPSFSNDGGYWFTDEKWTSVSHRNQPLLPQTNVWDFTAVAVNPTNKDEVAFGTYSRIPLLVSNDGATITDTFTFINSLIAPTSLGNGWSSISGLKFDNRSNLWVLNSLTQNPLKMKTAAGEWYEYSLGNAIANRYTRGIVIDNNNVKWFVVNGVGIMAFDDNNTPEDASDDRSQLLTTNPNSGDLPTNNIEAIAVDLDNNIWAGTTEGMRVLYASRNVFDGAPGTFNFQRLLIEFGEAVEIVLGTTHITAIAVDGANRKWFGTANSGVFLFSPDGLTLLENFTAQNSPLLSNAILDIAIDQNNGEVYFATDRGLVSFRGDASRGDITYSNVKVFPNPVLPTYEGMVTIQGIAANSEVRITDMSGKLVFKTRSNGGTATWDGRTLDGQRATTGVYLIFTAVDSQNVTGGRHVGKVVFIN